MVSTRRKSYVGGSLSQEQQERSEDSSSSVTSSSTTPARRNQRTSVGKQTPNKSVGNSELLAVNNTPVRRSRRLSNSSAGNSEDETSTQSSVRKRFKKEDSQPLDETTAVAESKQNDHLPSIKETDEPEMNETTAEDLNTEHGKDVSIPSLPTNEAQSAQSTDTSGLNQSENVALKSEKQATEVSSVTPNKTHTATPKEPLAVQKKSSDGLVNKNQIPRGKPKSGRVWKEPRTNPRTMYKDTGLKMPLEKVLQLKLEKQRVKEIENRLKEEKRLAKEDLRRRQELNKQRREANDKKGEIVQVIRNSSKLKRMKKKQLKLIQKRDTTNM